MKRNVFGILLVASLVAGPARADSFLDRGYGTPLFGQSARSRAMGGTGAALGNGVFSLIDNPAALMLTPQSRIQVAGWLSRSSENRFVPLYDTFGSFVSDVAVAVNDHGYGSASGGAVLDLRSKANVVVAAGIFDRYDPRYDYLDERRSTANTDDILSHRVITTTGVLRAASVGAAYSLGRDASVGATVHWLFGRVTDRDALVPRALDVSATDTTLVRELSGPSLALGATARAGERLTLGLAFETAPRLRDEFGRSENRVPVTSPGAANHVRLPWRLQGGVAYRPRNALLTTAAADVIYMPWSRLDDPLAPSLDLCNTWDVRFGLEHVYYNTLPGRIGFRYTRSYAMREADRASFTFGVGYKVEGYRLDVSGEIGKRTSMQEPLIPRADQGSYVGAGRDRVEDTLMRVGLGIEVDF